MTKVRNFMQLKVPKYDIKYAI